jgi:anti-sigma regulatory factor (Ser/Thr protein kinase)
MGKRGPGLQIRDYIINQVEDNPGAIVSHTADKFGISRQAILRYVNKLVSEGVLVSKGKTRGRNYHLGQLVNKSFVFTPKSMKVEEDIVWRTNVSPLINDIPDNVLKICEYGFTEILNNAIEHSEGDRIEVRVTRNVLGIELWISDNGVGIFNKISRIYKFNDAREAIFELTKGKLTTDPDKHSGEGIFFVSRMFDEFHILSGSLFFSHTFSTDDWLIENRNRNRVGTLVFLKIAIDSNRTSAEIFNKYANADSGFSTTHVPIKLNSYGNDNLVSRSQARRILSRFDRFREVLLDFDGVESIGQAFTDEVFRVFRANNPNTKLVWINANDGIENMIKRVLVTSETNRHS